jgi:hypothetical protein
MSYFVRQGASHGVDDTQRLFFPMEVVLFWLWSVTAVSRSRSPVPEFSRRRQPTVGLVTRKINKRSRTKSEVFDRESNGCAQAT